jgi:hypothetical protein
MLLPWERLLRLSEAWDVSNCRAVGYTSYVRKKKDLSFFRFPAEHKESSRWEAALPAYGRICSNYLETGE